MGEKILDPARRPCTPTWALCFGAIIRSHLEMTMASVERKELNEERMAYENCRKKSLGLGWVDTS